MDTRAKTGQVVDAFDRRDTASQCQDSPDWSSASHKPPEYVLPLAYVPEFSQKKRGFALGDPLMATANDINQMDNDREERVKSFKGVMKASTEIGVPLAMALGMFFTQLTMGNGWWAVVWFIAVYLLVLFVVKVFFPTH
jgi:hypothetical protein